MSLLPYYFDIGSPLREMERNFFNPVFSPRDVFVPSWPTEKPWGRAYSPWEMFQPLERLSEAVNRLALNKSDITADDEKFQVSVDVQHFTPEEISVKVANGHVIVEGKHEEKRDHHGYISRHFVRKYALPKGCLPDTVESKLSSDGVLTVVAPKVLPMPSTGEKIVPVVKTGPVKMQIQSSESEDFRSDSDKKQDTEQSQGKGSVEQK